MKNLLRHSLLPFLDNEEFGIKNLYQVEEDILFIELSNVIINKI